MLQVHVLRENSARDDLDLDFDAISDTISPEAGVTNPIIGQYVSWAACVSSIGQ